MISIINEIANSKAITVIGVALKIILQHCVKFKEKIYAKNVSKLDTIVQNVFTSYLIKLIKKIAWIFFVLYAYNNVVINVSQN